MIKNKAGRRGEKKLANVGLGAKIGSSVCDRDRSPVLGVDDSAPLAVRVLWNDTLRCQPLGGCTKQLL